MRKKITVTVARDYLIDRTTDFLGRDARFIAGQIKLRKLDREPNWDATIDVSGPDVVTAFGRATQREYNIEW
jgi:hypothetical protein